MKQNKILIIILSVIILIVLLIVIFFVIRNNNEPQDYNKVDVSTLKDLPEEIILEDLINEGCFVITNDKIYNKDRLEIFINNTEINAKNRIEDKIKIVEYNYDGYPTIYNLEYKVLDEKYINEEQKEVNKTGYILTTDSRRNNIIQGDITTNNDIPGEYYSITLKKDPSINAAIISLSLCTQTSSNNKIYKDIEIARYLLTDKNVNSTNVQEAVSNPIKMGIVELNHNGYIYMFGGQHFGELGYEIAEYTSSHIDNNNQTCIDYLTLKKYDTRYIEEGDLLICTRNSSQKTSTADDDLDTKDNPLIVLKSDDYYKMKQAVINENRKTTITIGDMYNDLGYLYLKYDFEDSTHSEKTFHFPFIQKVYITDNTKTAGMLEKGKTVEVEYTDKNSKEDGLDLKSIQIIK